MFGSGHLRIQRLRQLVPVAQTSGLSGGSVSMIIFFESADIHCPPHKRPSCVHQTCGFARGSSTQFWSTAFVWGRSFGRAHGGCHFSSDDVVACNRDYCVDLLVLMCTAYLSAGFYPPVYRSRATVGTRVSAGDCCLKKARSFSCGTIIR